MRPGNSGRTTSATGTSSCRACTASMSSLETFITSTPRRIRSSRTTRHPRTSPTSGRGSGRGAYCTRGQPMKTTRLRSPRWGRVGKQRIEDTGPLTRKRMETIDDEILEHGLDFIDRQASAGTPFFVWFNTTHMHFRTHPKPESIGQAGRWQSTYHDTMIDHDLVVGALLDKLDDLGIADDTIVVYSTDNGPHMNSWPDGGMTPFRSEKNTNWEGAFRIPEMVRWPGKISAGAVSNEIIHHHDWLPTFLAAAGEPDIVENLKAGHSIGDMTYKVHIDGFNLLPYLSGEVEKSPRQ